MGGQLLTLDPETTEVTECDTRSNLCFDLDLDTPATSVGTASVSSKPRST